MDLKNKTNEVVEYFIDKGWPFCGLDISNAIKREDGYEDVRHRDIAPLVREQYINGTILSNGYERTLINVTLPDGSKKQAYLYYHWSTSPDTYTNRCQEPVVPSRFKDADNDVSADDTDDSPKTVVVKTGDTVVVQNDTITRWQKADERLEIPATWVSDLGWDSGKEIYVESDGSHKATLNTSPSDPDDVVGIIVVGNDCRLRITKRVVNRISDRSRANRPTELTKTNNSVEVMFHP